MIKDLLVSFRDNFREKTTNPFLGTYFIVWLIRNWELIYTVFNFDEDQNLKDKVDFIKSYYSQHDFLDSLVTNIYWAFGLLISTYILLNMARLIINLSDKRITPWVYKITDSKSIVLRGEYERIRSERDELQIRLDQERDSKSKLENRIQNLESEIVERTSQKTNFKPSQNNVEEDSLILIRKLKDTNLLQDFKQIVVRINQGEYISNNVPTDYYVELGLLKFKDSDPRGFGRKYELTTDGENVIKRARLE